MQSAVAAVKAESKAALEKAETERAAAVESAAKMLEEQQHQQAADKAAVAASKTEAVEKEAAVVLGSDGNDEAKTWLAAFDAACTTCSNSSPVKQLFIRAAQLDETLTAIDLHSDPELMRWPVDRQRAAFALLRFTPHVTKVNLSGLKLRDDVASSLAMMLSSGAVSPIENLNLEGNDLREVGLLEIVNALYDNKTLKELRLTGQKMSVSKSVEEALAAVVDGGGATALMKLGHTFRNDFCKRRVDGALFRNTDRMRMQRTASRKSLGSSSGGTPPSQPPTNPQPTPPPSQPQPPVEPSPALMMFSLPQTSLIVPLLPPPQRPPQHLRRLLPLLLLL